MNLACFDTACFPGQQAQIVKEASDRRDSLPTEGGTIPGSGGHAAYSLSGPEPSAIPILVAVPHAGRMYPPNVVENMRFPGPASLKLEDRLVDRVATAVAKACGASLLLAHAPRAMIDLNRSPDEMDWTMVRTGAPAGLSLRRSGRRVRSGLGLVPRRLSGVGEVWKRPMEQAELDARIDGIHRPYHAALEQQLQSLRQRWGSVLLLDMHSMPPLSPRVLGDAAPRFVLGDRFGASCDGSLCAAAFDELSLQRQNVAHNRPYAGGYVLDRHGAPEKGIHALQVEICRSTYLDSRLAEPGPRLEETVEIMSALVRRLATEVAGLAGGGDWLLAAE